MKKSFLNLFTLILLCASMLWISSCQKDTANDETTPDQEVTERNNGNPRVFPPNASPYGMSYSEWTKVWLQQYFAYTTECDNVPYNNPEHALFYQNGPVYMMAGIAQEGGSADVTVPHGKAILIPLVNLWWNLCPGETVPPGMTLEEYLVGSVEGLMSYIDVSSLSVSIDGASVNNLSNYKFVTDVFEADGNSNPELLTCFDPCITGEPQPNALGGYYVMLKPLSKGQHTVHYHAEVPDFGIVQDGTFNITVQ